MAYSAILTSELAVNKPLTSSLMTRLRDNPEAIFLQLGWGTSASVYVSPEQTVAVGGAVTVSHGLSSITNGYDIDVSLYFICKTAQGGYNVGDVVPFSVSGQGSSASTGISTIVSTTQVTLRFGSTQLNMINASTGALFAITPGNWRIRIKARG